MPALYPRGLRQSGPRVYVRFHSRDAAAWYGAEKRRYDYSYSDAELAEWVVCQICGRRGRWVNPFPEVEHDFR